MLDSELEFGLNAVNSVPCIREPPVTASTISNDALAALQKVVHHEMFEMQKHLDVALKRREASFVQGGQIVEVDAWGQDRLG
jgi:hypothetical protein